MALRRDPGAHYWTLDRMPMAPEVLRPVPERAGSDHLAVAWCCCCQPWHRRCAVSPGAPSGHGCGGAQPAAPARASRAAPSVGGVSCRCALAEPQAKDLIRPGLIKAPSRQHRTARVSQCPITSGPYPRKKLCRWALSALAQGHQGSEKASSCAQSCSSRAVMAKPASRPSCTSAARSRTAAHWPWSPGSAATACRNCWRA